MTSSQFRVWRKGLHFTQAEAGDALGITPQTVSLFEGGDRESGRHVEIPKTVRLAMAAISLGFEDFPSEWLTES